MSESFVSVSGPHREAAYARLARAYVVARTDAVRTELEGQGFYVLLKRLAGQRFDGFRV